MLCAGALPGQNGKHLAAAAIPSAGQINQSVRAPPQHGLSSNKMALITSDCGTMCYPSTNGPNHLGFCALQCKAGVELAFEQMVAVGMTPESA